MPHLLGRDDVYIVHTLDGSETLYSRRSHATYHSLNGAVSESRHVFLRAGLLTQLYKPVITVLEYGFGTGLNAFLAYLLSNELGKTISYTGIEAFPLSADVAQLLDYPAYLAASDERPVFLRMHRETAFSKNHFTFSRLTDLAELDPVARFDCIFFDAFDPDVHVSAWTVDMFSALYAVLNEGGCLVTYCAQGQVRRDLVSVGFIVERLAGAPGKREMLRAWRK